MMNMTIILRHKILLEYDGTIYTREYGETTVLDRDVTDQLHQGYGLTYTGAPEQADFTALGDGHDQVDNLDAGFQHFGGG